MEGKQDTRLTLYKHRHSGETEDKDTRGDLINHTEQNKLGTIEYK